MLPVILRSFIRSLLLQLKNAFLPNLISLGLDANPTALTLLLALLHTKALVGKFFYYSLSVLVKSIAALRFQPWRVVKTSWKESEFDTLRSKDAEILQTE